MEERPVVDIAPIEDMLGRLSVRSAFGEPIQEGDTTVIPVATVACGFGYGSGYGRGPGKKPGQVADAPGRGRFTRGGRARRGRRRRRRRGRWRLGEAARLHPHPRRRGAIRADHEPDRHPVGGDAHRRLVPVLDLSGGPGVCAQIERRTQSPRSEVIWRVGGTSLSLNPDRPGSHFPPPPQPGQGSTGPESLLQLPPIGNRSLFGEIQPANLSFSRLAICTTQKELQSSRGASLKYQMP